MALTLTNKINSVRSVKEFTTGEMGEKKKFACTEVIKYKILQLWSFREQRHMNTGLDPVNNSALTHVDAGEPTLLNEQFDIRTRSLNTVSSFADSEGM